MDEENDEKESIIWRRNIWSFGYRKNGRENAAFFDIPLMNNWTKME